MTHEDHIKAKNKILNNNYMKLEKRNPLQYSCLGNPRDRGAWWAAINGVAQSQTQLK